MTASSLGIAACGLVSLVCVSAVGLLAYRRSRTDMADSVPGVDFIPALTGGASLAVTVAAFILFPGLPGWAEALVGGSAALLGAEGGRRVEEAMGADLVELYERGLQ